MPVPQEEPRVAWGYHLSDPIHITASLGKCGMSSWQKHGARAKSSWIHACLGVRLQQRMVWYQRDGKRKLLRLKA